MIHKVKEGCFQATTGPILLPGYYESERAARFAFKFDDWVLSRLQDLADDEGRNTGTISLHMMQSAAKELRERKKKLAHRKVVGYDDSTRL